MERSQKKQANGSVEADAVEEPKQQMDSKIDAIKKILFGENIQEYAAEFAKINRQFEDQEARHNQQITALHQEHAQTVASLKENFAQQLAALQEEFKQKTERLESAKTDRKALGDFLVELGKKLHE